MITGYDKNMNNTLNISTFTLVLHQKTLIRTVGLVQFSYPRVFTHICTT